MRDLGFRETIVCTALLLLAPGTADALPIKINQFDLEATGIEVVQSVQNQANEVRLVRDKPTMVRAYAIHTSTKNQLFFPHVKARLTAVRTAPGPEMSLGSLEAQAFVPDVPGFSRVSLPNSFNFKIPKAWRSGTVEFTVEVNSDGAYLDTNPSNDEITETVTFTAVPPVRLRLYSLFDPTTPKPTATDLALINSWLRRAFPSPGVDAEYRSTFSTVDLSEDTCDCPRNCVAQPNVCNANPGATCATNGDCAPGDQCITPPVTTRCLANPMVGCTSDLNCPVGDQCVCTKTGCAAEGTCSNDPNYPCSGDMGCGCARVNSWLILQRQLDDAYNLAFKHDRRYVGLLSDVGGFMRGCSPGVDFAVASGPTGDPSGYTFTSWDTDESFGDWYTGHELGHAYGLPHWTCCDAAGNTKVPYPMCELSNFDEHIGVDLALDELYRDNTYTDLMAYCPFQWTSNITYDDLMDRLILEMGTPLPTPDPPANKLLIVGESNASLSLARINGITELADAAVAPGRGAGGDFEIRLNDATGGSSSHFFTPTIYFDDHNFSPVGAEDRFEGTEAIGVFAEVVDIPVGSLTSIELFEDGELRDTRTPSSSAPTVTLDFPNGGEVLPVDETTVSWTAADADGDTLEFTLLYSTDGGTSWQSVAAGLVGVTSTVVDTSTLAGSDEVLFRILASDGFHTAMDTSDVTLTIPDASPRVVVAVPADNAHIEARSALVLEADAWDPEDGVLTGSSVSWSSDRQGSLGDGESLLVEQLAPGTHVITATAIDSSANTGVDAIVINVGDGSADACDAAPAACDTAASGILDFKDHKTPDKRMLKLTMKRTAGDYIGTDFGDPTNDTVHTLCFYEDDTLQAAHSIPASENFKVLGGEKGFKLKPAREDSLRKVVLKAGSTNRPNTALVSIKAIGADVVDLDPELETPTRVQLVNSTNDTCIEAQWTLFKKNEVGLVKGK